MEKSAASLMFSHPGHPKSQPKVDFSRKKSTLNLPIFSIVIGINYGVFWGKNTLPLVMF
jgi:hypothetical protein